MITKFGNSLNLSPNSSPNLSPNSSPNTLGNIPPANLPSNHHHLTDSPTEGHLGFACLGFRAERPILDIQGFGCSMFGQSGLNLERPKKKQCPKIIPKLPGKKHECTVKTNQMSENESEKEQNLVAMLSWICSPKYQSQPIWRHSGSTHVGPPPCWTGLPKTSLSSRWQICKMLPDVIRCYQMLQDVTRWHQISCKMLPGRKR